MKKTIAVLGLVLVVCACAFASQRVSVYVDPFSFQSFVQKNGDVENSVNSEYGIGGGIGYNWEFGKGFILGADIKADTYTFEEQKNFTDVSFLAKAGYIAKVSDTVGLYANIKAGLDLQVNSGVTSAVLEFGPEVGLEYSLNDSLNLFASCEGLFGFPKSEEAKYAEFRVTPVVGAGLTF